MRNAACFEPPRILARNVDSIVGQATEQQTNVALADRHPNTLVFRVAHRPTAPVQQPVSKGDDRLGFAFSNHAPADVTRGIDAGRGQCHHRGLHRVVRFAL